MVHRNVLFAIVHTTLLQRDGMNVTTVWRERGVIDPAAIAQAGASR